MAVTKWAAGCFVGLVAPVVIFAALTRWLSRLILPPEGAERNYRNVYELLPGLLPVVAALAVIAGRPR